MRLVYIVAGAEVVLGLLLGAYLVFGLALSEKPVPLWLAAIAAVVFWFAFWELARHARELVERQKEVEE